MNLKKLLFSKVLLLSIILVILATVVSCTTSTTVTTTPSPTPAVTASPSATIPAGSPVSPSPSVSPAPSPSPSATVSPSASPTPTGTAASTYTINVSSKAGIGNYLVDSKGMTLYYTMRDSPGVSNVPDNLLTTWIPFYTANVLVPPSLNASDFGSITRSNGDKLTTFKGYPLYYYVGDKAPGDTNGQGIGGVWYVINPTDFPPTPAATPSPSMIMPSPSVSTSPTSTPGPSATASPSTASTGNAVTIDLVAQNIAFNLKTITVPAGAAVTINFDNKDVGIPHNFALYQSGSGTTGAATGNIFTGQTVVGPGTAVYKFTAPATTGNYFFRCDIHPTIMYGTFTVTAS